MGTDFQAPTRLLEQRTTHRERQRLGSKTLKQRHDATASSLKWPIMALDPGDWVRTDHTRSDTKARPANQRNVSHEMPLPKPHITAATTLLMTSLMLPASVLAADSPNQPAIDACVEELQATGLPSQIDGRVISSSFSQAGTEVMLEHTDGTLWRCIVYADSTIGYLEPATPKEEASARRTPQLPDYQEAVQFEAGSTSTTLARTLPPGGAFQFLLDAQSGQRMQVEISPQGDEMYYTIRNPGGDLLQTGTPATETFDSQLALSGEHVVEVVNQTSHELTYEIAFTIQ